VSQRVGGGRRTRAAARTVRGAPARPRARARRPGAVCAAGGWVYAPGAGVSLGALCCETVCGREWAHVCANCVCLRTGGVVFFSLSFFFCGHK